MHRAVHTAEPRIHITITHTRSLGRSLALITWSLHVALRLRRLDVVEDVLPGRRLLSPRLDDHTAGAAHLTCLALGVADAQAGLLADRLAVLDLDERDLVLLAQCGDQLRVGGLLAVAGQHT